MAKPVSSGRMIRKNISQSKKIASLSKESIVLFLLIIPHLNAHGKMNGNPHFIKGEVCPLLTWLTVDMIERCLCEITEKTNLKYYEVDGLFWIQSLSWKDHQDLRIDRLSSDEIPDYSKTSPGVVRDLSGSSPEKVRHEVEVEVEGKVKEEVEEERGGVSRTSPGLGTHVTKTPALLASSLKRFVQPSLDDIKNYIANKNPEKINQAELFFHHFESVGWFVGKSPMKNWHAALDKWLLRSDDFTNNKKTASVLSEDANKFLEEIL